MSAGAGTLTRDEPGRRERRKRETRARLLAAARSLFVERGYHATRPQDIARAADLAAGTFYVHFGDKREVFRAFVEEASSELMGGMHEAAAGGPESDFRARFFAILSSICAFHDRHPGVLRVAFADPAVIGEAVPGEEGLREQLAARLAAGLRAGMARGAFHADYDPELIAHAIVGFVQSGLVFGVRAGRARDRLLADLTDFCARALVRAPDPAEPPR